MKVIQNFFKKWNVYKHRFLPWIALNLNPGVNFCMVKDESIGNDKVTEQLTTIFSHLKNTEHTGICPNIVLEQVTGFQINRQISKIPGAGSGAFVSKGCAKKGQVVAIYPGTVYLPSDTIFFQSIANSFIFRCKDFHHIDGKDTGISKSIFKSCMHRDRVGIYDFCDATWLTSQLVCPLSVGQYVNNKTSVYKPNVQYQEFNFMSDFPLELRKFIPNINYGGAFSLNYQKTVVLVATTNIYAGDEIVCDYFTASKKE